jgi:hypothetical protein
MGNVFEAYSDMLPDIGFVFSQLVFVGEMNFMLE